MFSGLICISAELFGHGHQCVLDVQAIFVAQGDGAGGAYGQDLAVQVWPVHLAEVGLGLLVFIRQAGGADDVAAAHLVGHERVEADFFQHRHDRLHLLRLALVGAAQVQRHRPCPAEGSGPVEQGSLFQDFGRRLLVLGRAKARRTHLLADGAKDVQVVQGAARLAVAAHQAVVHHLLDLGRRLKDALQQPARHQHPAAAGVGLQALDPVDGALFATEATPGAVAGIDIVGEFLQSRIVCPLMRIFVHDCPRFQPYLIQRDSNFLPGFMIFFGSNSAFRSLMYW